MLFEYAAQLCDSLHPANRLRRLTSPTGPLETLVFMHGDIVFNTDGGAKFGSQTSSASN